MNLDRAHELESFRAELGDMLGVPPKEAIRAAVRLQRRNDELRAELAKLERQCARQEAGPEHAEVDGPGVG